MWLGRSHAPREVPVVSTGSFALDIALGIGGLPKVIYVDAKYFIGLIEIFIADLL